MLISPRREIASTSPRTTLLGGRSRLDSFTSLSSPKGSWPEGISLLPDGVLRFGIMEVFDYVAFGRNYGCVL